ncbi:hypothetical protein ACFY2V_16925 [Streptomyces eurythermus]
MLRPHGGVGSARLGSARLGPARPGQAGPARRPSFAYDIFS